MPRADFQFRNEGSVWLCQPQSRALGEHLRENVSSEAQWWGTSLVVEPRFVRDLASRLEDNGYVVMGASF